jgi:hypothetical protein
MAYTDDKQLTVQKAETDFRTAYRAKRKLIEREMEDFRFALGEQWSEEDKAKLERAGVKPITDNRIQPNLFLLTGLERQNRTDFKAFPEGEEDSLKAEIASALFKHSIKVSDFQFKSSEQFKDGATCGESHLELYLDNTFNLINAKPCWKKLDGNRLFPAPGWREYDFNDAPYVYKVTLNLSREDLINLFPEKQSIIEEATPAKMDFDAITGGEELHRQPKDYPKSGGSEGDDDEEGFDLIERYYKKMVSKAYIGDYETGRIEKADSQEKAQGVVDQYRAGIQAEQDQYAQALQSYQMAQAAPQLDENGQPITGPMSAMGAPMEPPVAPPPKDPNRLKVIKRMVPEIWCFAYSPGQQEPWADERAWFYPNWTTYPFVPFFARFSTAPLEGDDRHLLIQGIVHSVKGVQEKHNKAEMLMIRHLNSSTNSGWLVEEDTWVDRSKVEQFGTQGGVNLEYKVGKPPPQRISPMPLSQGHAELAAESAEAIKAQLGINADLLASQEGGADSGRAIALRQRQGLLMVQELYDNLSRSRVIAGKLLLSQFPKIYDTETAMKVLGEAFLTKNFPPPMQLVEGPGGLPQVGLDGAPAQQPMTGPDGQPMQYDKEMAEVTIAEVLSGNLGEYDVAVGEAVASETTRIANSQELKDIAQTYPGLIPPDLLIEESQLPQSTKQKVLGAIKQAQAMAQVAAQSTAAHAAPKQPAQPGAAA